MELYVYIFKLRILDGRPSMRWLPKCRWYLLRTEPSYRFKSVLSMLESYGVPRVELEERRYLLIKSETVKEILTVMAPDLVHDVIITPEKIKSLDDDYWTVEKFKFGVKGIALWQTGLQTKSTSKLTEVKQKFEAIYKALNEKVNEGMQKS
jgi:hypothetical protein